MNWNKTLRCLLFTLPLLMIGAALPTPAHAQAMNTIHIEKSLYREVLVYEQDGERCMCFTRECRIGRQSCIILKDPHRFALNYARMMMAGALFTGAPPKRILIVGLGGGTLPMALAEVLPDAQIDVVEIDPAVARVAKKYFGFKEGPKMTVHEVDGRVYVKRAGREGKKYDLVMLDAFDHEYIPEHLLTKEFLTEVKSLLAPEGVLVANTFSSSRLYDAESATYASVYDKIFNLKRENRVIVARPAGLPDDATLRQKALEYAVPLRSFGVDSESLVSLFSRTPDWDVKARVLTDQYSPANLLNR
ncbi:MAG: fused MFS/spermidine synthase [Nevskiaceae bacterium]|jgi:spermidine synthase|nr:fused MFS/spermidine synthase [Nevskiaceae bacterium]